MAQIECKSAQKGVPSAFVELAFITDAEIKAARESLDRHLAGGGQISTAVATAFIELTAACPKANLSDLWQHVFAVSTPETI